MKDIDPIDELHEVRRKILAEAGGTPAALMRYLRALEKKEAAKDTLAKSAAKAPTRRPGKRSKAVAQ